MTFEEAFELLNHGNAQAVAQEMKTWHPAILGAMLAAIAEAKRIRYPLNHDDFNRGVQAVEGAAGVTINERIQQIRIEGIREQMQDDE